MPIKGNIKSSKFAPQIRNYDTNTGSNKLKGGISEFITVVYQLELYWYSEPKLFEIFDGGGRIIRTDGGNFLSSGFQIGESFVIQWNFGGTGVSQAGVISSISEEGKTLFTNINNPSYDGVYDEIAECLITGDDALTNLDYSFGLIENSEPFSIASKLEGTDQRYYVGGINQGGYEQGSISGTVKGWASDIDLLQVIRLADSDIPIFRAPNFGGSAVVTGTVLNYEIIHQFPLMPYFVAGQLQNLKDGIAPSFLAGSNSLKQVFECVFKKNLSDEDSNKIIRFDNLKGSVGNYGENFNGFSSQYSLDSINYFAPSLLANPSLLVQEITDVVVVVNSANGTFTGGQNVIVSHSYLPDDETEYENSTDFFNENLVFESIPKGSSGSIVQSVSTSLINANQLEITFSIDVTGAKPTLTAESNYLLSVILEDDLLSQEDSDRTIILLDINNYDLSPDIPDLLEVLTFNAFDHGTDVSETGNTDFKGWVQDGYAVQGLFQLDRTKNALLETFSVQLVAWEDGTDNYFLIQDNNFNISNAVIDNNGNQQILINDTQGFKLDPLDQFNAKTFITGSFDGTFIQYLFNLGLKINWQEWLSLQDVDPVFLDFLEPNQGLNQNSSRYSLKEGYTLQTIIKAGVISSNSVVTDYIHKLSMNVNDFGEIASEDWEMLAIETFDESNNSLEGSIINNEYVRIKATFQPNFVITPDLNDYYGIIRIDTQLSQGNKEIYEMSSVRSIPQNNLLIPLEGESLLKLSLSGSNVVLECRTNKNQIQNINYSLSARLGGKGVVILGDFNDDFSNDFFN